MEILTFQLGSIDFWCSCPSFDSWKPTKKGHNSAVWFFFKSNKRTSFWIKHKLDMDGLYLETAMLVNKTCRTLNQDVITKATIVHIYTTDILNKDVLRPIIFANVSCVWSIYIRDVVSSAFDTRGTKFLEPSTTAMKKQRPWKKTGRLRSI